MTRTMTGQERVLTALALRQPDRVPLDLGGTKNSTIHIVAYEALVRYLGLSLPGPRLCDRMMQVVDPDEAVLQRLGVDTRAVYEGPPDHPRGHPLDENSYVDDWGVVRRRPPDGYYYDLVSAPLSGEVSTADIVHYHWPDPLDPGIVRPLIPRIEHLRRTTDSALVLHLPSPFVHKSQYLMGFADWFTNIALAPRLMETLFDAVLELSMAQAKAVLEVAGHLVDVVNVSDDVADQNGPIISPRAYRQLIAPRHRAYFELIRARTAAPILYHSCGSLYVLMEDLLALGIQALNPVQVSARDMETDRLKREFGDRVAFWGGVDTQRVLPFGTPDDVRAEVRRRVRDLGPGGGYVLGAVHNIQAEVPPENICAMFEAAREFGRYNGPGLVASEDNP